MELAEKYQVKAYPTFVVLKADGTEVYRTSGGSSSGRALSTKFVKGLIPSGRRRVNSSL